MHPHQRGLGPPSLAYYSWKIKCIRMESDEWPRVLVGLMNVSVHHHHHYYGRFLGSICGTAGDCTNDPTPQIPHSGMNGGGRAELLKECDYFHC